MRILIVEDEVKIREGMARLIHSGSGHMIVGEAENGAQGLEMILRFKPDLVITDIRMPVLDGLEMLRELEKKGVQVHTVILSGYSEFSYAQKAIQYGVDDYLLKPIAPEDLEELLDRVSEKISRENQMIQGQAESLLREILGGDQSHYGRLETEYGFHKYRIYSLLMGYIGGAAAGYREIMRTRIKELEEKFENLNIYSVYNENEQKAYFLLAAEEEKEELPEDFEKSFYRRLIAMYQGQETTVVWTRERFRDLRQLKKAAEELAGRMDNALVLDVRGWLSRRDVQNYTAQPYQYPADIASQFRSAICQEDPAQIREAGAEFLQYMNSRHFRPEDVKQAFLKLYFSAEDTIREINQDRWKRLKSRNIQRQLESGVVWQELKSAFEDMLEILCDIRVQREDISNYVIKKAINYVREHYQEGIKVEEIAAELHITPEYLSTLFNREMNVKFSVFLRRFRISHAKRLLKGTEMKIYEVSEAVGYNDSKYFARVFKEEVGITPAEYRQME